MKKRLTIVVQAENNTLDTESVLQEIRSSFKSEKLSLVSVYPVASDFFKSSHKEKGKRVYDNERKVVGSFYNGVFSSR